LQDWFRGRQRRFGVEEVEVLKMKVSRRLTKREAQIAALLRESWHYLSFGLGRCASNIGGKWYNNVYGVHQKR